jgi:hypothetical protein
MLPEIVESKSPETSMLNHRQEASGGQSHKSASVNVSTWRVRDGGVGQLA